MNVIMLKGIKLFFIIVGVCLLQTVIMPEIKFWGITPNLFLITVCGISFLFGSKTGGICGLVLGLFQDMNIGRTIGLNAFIYMYVGIILGQFNKRFFKDNYVVSVIFVIFATIAYETIIYIFGALAYNQNFVFSTFLIKILIGAFANAIISVIVYPVLLRINIGVELDRRIFGRR